MRDVNMAVKSQVPFGIFQICGGIAFKCHRVELTRSREPSYLSVDIDTCNAFCDLKMEAIAEYLPYLSNKYILINILLKYVKLCLSNVNCLNISVIIVLIYFNYKE